MVAWSKQRCDLLGLLGEVDSLARRPRRVAGAGHEHERVPLGERALLRPGRRRVAHAAVDEHDAGPLPEHLGVRLVHRVDDNPPYKVGRK